MQPRAVARGFLKGGATPLGGSDGKESACSVGDLGLIPGLGRSPGREHGNPPQYSWASLVAQLVKESTCNAGDLGSIPGLGRSPGEGKGYPLQYSALENSRVTKSGRNWVTFTFTLCLQTLLYVYKYT